MWELLYKIFYIAVIFLAGWETVSTIYTCLLASGNTDWWYYMSDKEPDLRGSKTTLSIMKTFYYP